MRFEAWLILQIVLDIPSIFSCCRQMLFRTVCCPAAGAEIDIVYLATNIVMLAPMLPHLDKARMAQSAEKHAHV
jgi:hypothetical protein